MSEKVSLDALEICSIRGRVTTLPERSDGTALLSGKSLRPGKLMGERAGHMYKVAAFHEESEQWLFKKCLIH